MDAQENSINNAVAKLLTPQEEQGDVAELEPKSLPQETEEAITEEPSDTDQEDTDVVLEEAEDVGDPDPEDDQEDDQEEPHSESDTFYSVKVDGEEYEVNLEELKKGYQLEKNYTKNKQQLKAEQEELATLRGSLEAERSKYLQVTQQLAQEQQSQWEAAKAELKAIDKSDDPIGYVQKQLEIQDIEESFKAKADNYNYALTQKQQEDNANLQQYLQQQAQELSEALPEWTDPETSEALKEGITKFAKTQGYTEEEISNVKTAKDIIVLNKARLYDEMMAKRAVVRDKRAPQKATAKVRPANRKSESTQKARAVKAQKDSFKRSGNVKDATALLTQLMQQRKPISHR
ncbi:hypothetical protein N8314_00670 [Akkermansiaceae bacterium]|nr:hypothetical protein [Akkermansiaceae bacterium]